MEEQMLGEKFKSWFSSLLKSGMCFLFWVFSNHPVEQPWTTLPVNCASLPTCTPASFFREALGFLHICTLLTGKVLHLHGGPLGPLKKQAEILKGVWSSFKIWFHWVMTYSQKSNHCLHFQAEESIGNLILADEERRKVSSLPHIPRRALMKLPQ